MLPQKVKENLQTKIIGRTIHCFREVPSTNDIAKELAGIGAKQGTVIVAEAQTRGRGRLNREWVSPEGGMWFSITLRPEVSLKDAPKLTLIASLAVAKTTNRLFNLKAEIKWPNDVLINGRKVCGILTESRAKGGVADFVVVGVGINTNFNLDSLPTYLRDSATTIKEELKREIDREDFLRALLEETEHYYDMFNRGEFDAILKDWRKLAIFLGSYVEVTSPDEKIEGWATDIDENGALILKLPDQTIRKVIAGDITIRRKVSFLQPQVGEMEMAYNKAGKRKSEVQNEAS